MPLPKDLPMQKPFSVIGKKYNKWKIFQADLPTLLSKALDEKLLLLLNKALDEKLSLILNKALDEKLPALFNKVLDEKLPAKGDDRRICVKSDSISKGGKLCS